MVAGFLNLFLFIWERTNGILETMAEVVIDEVRFTWLVHWGGWEFCFVIIKNFDVKYGFS